MLIPVPATARLHLISALENAEMTPAEPPPNVPDLFHKRCRTGIQGNKSTQSDRLVSPFFV